MRRTTTWLQRERVETSRREIGTRFIVRFRKAPALSPRTEDLSRGQKTSCLTVCLDRVSATDGGKG